MRRAILFMMLVLAMSSISVAPSGAKAPGPNGRIAFDRFDPTVRSFSTYTVNPDGTHERKLIEGEGSPRWSPDGTEIAVPGCPGQGEGACMATIVDVDTGASREFPNPDPSFFNVFIGCNVWSPDGSKLACTTGGEAPGATGIYTIRASDGGGLTRVLSCGCTVMDYSPDGRRLLFSEEESEQLFTVRVNGLGLRQVTPTGTLVDWEQAGTASWSPSGNRIVFGGQSDTEHRRSIFVVNADGSGLHEVRISGCGGAFSDPRAIGCQYPGWSPDGTKIVFRRNSSGINVQAIYTANADGSGLSQVTTGTNLDVGTPDWGTHSLATLGIPFLRQSVG
jgi:TolB protein